MAFDFGAWLRSKADEKNGEGQPLYPPEVLQDLVALVVLSTPEGLKDLGTEAASLVGQFAIRSGLNDAKPGEFKALLDKYFSAHPLPKELVQSFQTEFQREPSGKKQKLVRQIRG